MSVQEFNSDDVKRRLLDAHQKRCLTQELEAQWRLLVPHVFSARLDADTNSEERKARKFLLSPIEVFLCGGSPEEVFKQLKELDSPPQLCGKVFKLGDPTYLCRDCGTDPTCVLCFNCFEHSEHNKHRYRVMTSGGGGYCDCGDPEAWKTYPYCSLHMPSADAENRDPTQALPRDLLERARELFLAVLQYASQMLLWVHPDSLPSSLQPDNMEDTYVTMLFNDEVHTYEQVISTLQKAVDCSSKEAVDFATTVDREGRSPVRFGKYDVCRVAKEVVVKQTSRGVGNKPLKVDVMHTTVVAHQIFASKLLTWLSTVITNSEGLRKLFCLKLLDPQEGHELSLLETILMSDTQLWKAARIQTHQLFMAGILMDQECKKKFAILLTKMYPQLLDQFVKDDHEHTVCAVSETVQIFTVPTLLYGELMRHFIADDHERKVSILSSTVQIFTTTSVARFLITEHNLLAVILNTFLEECERKLKDDTFAFDKQDRHHSFRRAQYSLYDLRYALSTSPTPSEWNDKLRENFINGFDAYLKLLGYMQGMDAVTRQTGQHIEFELEWEGGFTLQLKLEDTIQAMIDWCTSDRDVLMKACQCILKHLETKQNKLPGVKYIDHQVANHVVSCIDYNVAKEPVSIHQPLTRILSGLLPQASRYGQALQDIEALIRSCILQPELFIEPSLRCQVLIAQTHAGMWKRNGFSLINQIYYYFNVKCRTEMYDRDISILQAGAAMIDENHFIVHLINKFALTNWIRDDFDQPKESMDDLIRQKITLAEEFLNLLIVILGERYQPGIGAVDKKEVVKHEVIHQLCLQAMPHSELSKSLPDDSHHETGLEDVVLEVADFKKASGPQGKGMYELKPVFYELFNPLFYHYSRTEQSKAEEVQKKRRKQAGLDQALPPPIPPPFEQGFSRIINLLTCDVMIYMMKLILTRTGAKRSRSWSEVQFEKILHLIGLALHEEKRAHYLGKPFTFIERATQGDPSMLSLLEGLTSHTTIQKDLLMWVLKLFQEVRQLRDKSYSSDTRPIHTPAVDEKVSKEKRKKAEKASKRRDRIMAQMSRMQKNFIKENEELFLSTQIDDNPSDLVRVNSDMDISDSANGIFSVSAGESESVQTVVLGPKKSMAWVQNRSICQTCILCQEEQTVTPSDRAMVLAAYVQKSAVLSKQRKKKVEDPATFDPLFMSSDLFVGFHTNTCSHVMHADCWQRYYQNVLEKERRRSARFRSHISFDASNFEYLCPYCKTLSNTVIPIVPYLTSLKLERDDDGQIDLSFDDWLDGIQKIVHSSVQDAKEKEAQDENYLFVPCPLSSITKMMAESVAKNFQVMFEYVYVDSSTHFSDSINEMLKKFSQDVYRIGLGVLPDDQNERIPMVAWNTCAFTIMTIEQLLRHDKQAVFGPLSTRQEDCLNSMVRFAAVSSNVLQKDVVQRHCVTLLSALLCDQPSQRLQETPGLLDIDMFHFLVSVCMSLPALYMETEDAASSKIRLPQCDLNDLHLLELVTTAHLVQVMLTSKLEAHDSMEIEGLTDAEIMVQFYMELRHKAGLTSEMKPSAWQLLSHLKEAMLPFLRCCALLFHYISAIKPSDILQSNLPSNDEFEALCRYLGLPTDLSLYFSGHLIKQLVTSWCSDEMVKKKLQPEKLVELVSYPLSVNRLVSLPAHYSQLINQVSTFTCPNSSGDDSRVPTMCLVCGEMLCSQSYCCQTELDGSPVGAATAHADICGAGTGIFLRVRECQILLQNNKTKGCFYSPPYLDDYGEADPGLRRGNPLHLNDELYKKLHKLWLSHTIPEEIAHYLESNSNLIAVEWNHL